MCNTISDIILKVINHVYPPTLLLPYVVIDTCTPLQILAHLYTNYNRITPENIDNNDRYMEQPCNINQPI